MREFIRRALLKTSRMNADQIQGLLSLITEEYELLDAVLDSLSTGVIVCDFFHVIVQFNKAAVRILPFEHHDILEKPAWECVKNKEIAAFVRNAIEGEETVISREFGIDEANQTRFLSVSVMPLVRKKSVRGTIITLEDITDKKNDEMRNRRLENLASLTNLAATVAHEIKNPLGSISIYVQLLRKALGKNGLSDDPSMKKSLDVVEEEIERLNKIVVDFLFAVRPLRFDFAPVDMNALIRSLADFFSEEANAAGVTITLDLSEGLLPVWGDDRFLRQMFINLVKNSLSAVMSGGIIRIRTRHEEDTLIITVEDNGTGIPEDQLQKVFEPYFTTKIDGTGLGLAMTYKVVKEHGGDIRVQSELGLGTCFTITLPVMRKAQRLIGYEEGDGQE